jgi:hypothetical protein
MNVNGSQTMCAGEDKFGPLCEGTLPAHARTGVYSNVKLFSAEELFAGRGFTKSEAARILERAVKRDRSSDTEGGLTCRQ